MSQIFAITQHSITTGYDRIMKEMEALGISKRALSLIENHTVVLPKTPILVFSDFDSLYNHRNIVGKRRAIIIIIDTLPRVFGIEGITILDAEQPKEGYSYIFRPHAINMSPLRKALKKVLPEKLRRSGIEAAKYEVIPPLIDLVRKGMILDKINNIVYKTPDPLKRDSIRNKIIGFLTEKSTLDELKKDLESMFKRGLALSYVSDLIEFLKTDKGVAHQKALTEVSNYSKKTPINLRKIADNHGVERAELRYLSMLYKSLKRPEPSVGLVHELGDFSSMIKNAKRV